MSFPIPSFFKIRCGIIIIAFLLFFMFIGMLKQALAVTCSPAGATPGWGLASSTVYSTQQYASAACASVLATLTVSHSGCSYAGSPFFYYFIDDYTNHSHYKFSHCACDNYDSTTGACDLSSCPDSDSDGRPDACETCPSQTGYKTNLGIISYCGQTTTFCDGQRLTTYEFGFGPDSCLPATDPPCCATSVSAGCRKDSDCDGIADIYDTDIDNDGTPNSEDDDVDGDGIPNSKDLDFDGDGDSKPDPNDPCPGNPDPNCVDPCAGITDGTCKDTDGDGKRDDQDPCPSNPDTSCVNPCAGSSDPTCKDTDGDGTPDDEDTDDDGDGKPDDQDPCRTNPDPSCTNPCAGSSDPTCKDDNGNGIADDSETKPYESKVDPYSAKEETSSQIGARFGDRFKKFFDDMKATSVFSIPGQIFGDLPTGGSPTFMINGGQTFGTHELNMDSWVPGLAALRAVLYIIAGWGAIKIALLGK